MLKRHFVTGCDHNTEWQLPWFIDNFFRHSDCLLMIENFGMSKEMKNFLEVHPLYKQRMFLRQNTSTAKGWFKKPRAIYDATSNGFVACWLDTDCQINGDIDSIWRLYEGDKLNMVKDRPWTTRRPENGDWYNSGVVMTNRNTTLEQWMLQCESTPDQGDQEVLYYMYTPIERLSKINPLPHTYNTLRIDYIDNIAVKDPIVIHHTGRKGNEKIREMMTK